MEAVEEVFGFNYKKDIGPQKPNVSYLMPVRFFAGDPDEFQTMRTDLKKGVQQKYYLREQNACGLSSGTECMRTLVGDSRTRVESASQQVQNINQLTCLQNINITS